MRIELEFGFNEKKVTLKVQNDKLIFIGKSKIFEGKNEFEEFRD